MRVSPPPDAASSRVSPRPPSSWVLTPRCSPPTRRALDAVFTPEADRSIFFPSTLNPVSAQSRRAVLHAALRRDALGRCHRTAAPRVIFSTVWCWCAYHAVCAALLLFFVPCSPRPTPPPPPPISIALRPPRSRRTCRCGPHRRPRPHHAALLPRQSPYTSRAIAVLCPCPRWRWRPSSRTTIHLCCHPSSTPLLSACTPPLYRLEPAQQGAGTEQKQPMDEPALAQPVDIDEIFRKIKEIGLIPSTVQARACPSATCKLPWRKASRRVPQQPQWLSIWTTSKRCSRNCLRGKLVTK
jgi:hypothetical protein